MFYKWKISLLLDVNICIACLFCLLSFSLSTDYFSEFRLVRIWQIFFFPFYFLLSLFVYILLLLLLLLTFVFVAVFIIIIVVIVVVVFVVVVTLPILWNTYMLYIFYSSFGLTSLYPSLNNKLNYNS